MDFLKRNAKRVATDAVGYLLLIAAALTGWLPGPGGIPLALAGLALLSINNEWARKLREHILLHGGKFISALFPSNPLIQWLYDLVVVLLLAVVTVLVYRHAAVWQIGLSVSLFLIALLIALMNRDRLTRFKNRRKH